MKTSPQNEQNRKGLSLQAKFLNRLAATNALPQAHRVGDSALTIKMNLGGRRPGDAFGYCYASGAGLARVLTTIGSAKDFMLITAFRSERSKAENEKDFRALPGILRSFFKSTSLGAYWLVGHWTECKGALKGTKIDQCVAEGGEIVDALEYSWLFVKTDESVSGDAWLRAGTSLANLTDQFAFVIRLNGEVTVRYASGAIKDRLTTDASVEKAWQHMAELRAGGSEYGYTELRKVRERGRIQPIVFNKETSAKTSSYHIEGSGKPFAPHFFLAVPNSNSAKMVFSGEGIDYRVAGVVIPGDCPSGGTVWEPNA